MCGGVSGGRGRVGGLVLVELMKEPGGDQRRENEMAFDLVGRLASDSGSSRSSRPQKCKVVWKRVRVECVHV